MNNASASLYLFACTCNSSQVGATLLVSDTFLFLVVLLAEIGFTEAVPKPPPVLQFQQNTCAPISKTLS